MNSIDTNIAPVQRTGKQWVRPLIEEVSLEPTDDILGACYTSAEPGVAGGCNSSACAV